MDFDSQLTSAEDDMGNQTRAAPTVGPPHEEHWSGSENFKVAVRDVLSTSGTWPWLRHRHSSVSMCSAIAYILKLGSQNIPTNAGTDPIADMCCQ
eukprot:12413182-Karenia_brevis.AAC.1